MRRHVLKAVAGLLMLALFGVAIRYDLSCLGWRRGIQRLLNGDQRGAQELLARAASVMPGNHSIAFNQGVALYRLDDYRAARERFAAAARAVDPGLRAAASYNLGNCAFRQGEQLAVSDRSAARRLFQEADAEFGRSLAIAPGAADARHNLEVVRARLASLAGESPSDQSGKRGSKGVGQGESKGRDTQREGEPTAGRRNGEGKGEAKATPGDRANSAASSVKKAPALTRDQAERLLNEARGREALPPSTAGRGGKGSQEKPEKDW